MLFQSPKNRQQKRKARHRQYFPPDSLHRMECLRMNIFSMSALMLYFVLNTTKSLSVSMRGLALFGFQFVSLSSSKTWTDGAIDGAYIVLSNGDPKTYVMLKSRISLSGSHCMQIFRLQLPQNQKFNTRLIYCIKLQTINTEFKCCVDSKRIKWFDRKDIIDGKVERVWGPEVMEYCELSTGSKRQHIEEYSLDQAFFYVPRDPPRNLEEELLRSTDYTEKDVERIYTDFVEHCFPAFYMTLTSFTDYMTKYGFERKEKRIKRFFSAFNFSNSGYLSFSEFLIGMTSIER